MGTSVFTRLKFHFIFFDFVYFEIRYTFSKDKIDIFENIYPIFISL